MIEQRPDFMACKNPGTGWRIDILWADGETEVIKGFVTEHDATKWISEHSAARQEHTSQPRQRDFPGSEGASTMGRETEELASKTAECAREARHQAALLPEGPVRDALLEKAKQYEAQIPDDPTYTTVAQR
ncbi:hypothetical protein [Bradyrhizobium brasilense]|uniref:Integrase n=1 Tax=Bradyrhizobium brasilense TaxID=1419277 RepID=A0ABY8JAW6_9BRAD|nr:hypothetical protein [Bradyrhizobium brasilense]WFU62707.1 hypothetical protein QA636_35560 [Bradyrhizobium brasilense]